MAPAIIKLWKDDSFVQEPRLADVGQVAIRRCGDGYEWECDRR